MARAASFAGVDMTEIWIGVTWNATGRALDGNEGAEQLGGRADAAAASHWWLLNLAVSVARGTERLGRRCVKMAVLYAAEVEGIQAS